jgi:phosphatidyl-myo-inositol dimannoside synthase
VSKVLIVTNDFPPRVGGIQAFVHSLALQLPAQVVVYAPAWQGDVGFDRALPFPVVRHTTSLMLPVRQVRQRAIEIMNSHGCDTVLFGAAAPLGLLAPSLRKAGAQRIVALTHGHEAGWAALPGASSLLRKIGDSVDVMTYLGGYFRARLAKALSPAAIARMQQFAPSVDTETFRPGAGGLAIRERLGLERRPIILCVARLVARKGQDTLIRALPDVLACREATLVFVGHGRYAGKLQNMAHKLGVAANVVFAGEVSAADLPAYYDAADVFAMPCRTRLGGLDTEGLGISALEAAATGLPVIVGDSGGAPDAVIDGETGFVVPGRDPKAVANRLKQLLADPASARAMGQKGRAWMERAWRWNSTGHHLKDLIASQDSAA